MATLKSVCALKFLVQLLRLEPLEKGGLLNRNAGQYIGGPGKNFLDLSVWLYKTYSKLPLGVVENQREARLGGCLRVLQ